MEALNSLDIPTPPFSYRHYLEREFRRRCRRNSLYSLRAFARDLETSVSKLSEVLRGKCGLSIHAAEQLCKLLKLSEVESEHFILMVEAEHSRNSHRKEQAQELLKGFQIQHGYSELDLERFKIISDWQHLALLELMELEDYQSNLEWMAQKLNLDFILVSESMERLERFNLIESHEGQWRPVRSNISISTGVPSREIREFHLQLMEKSLDSVENGKIQERDVSHIMFAMNEKDFPRAQEVLKKFRREFASQFQVTEHKNSVYCLGTQFIPLTVKKEQQ